VPGERAEADRRLTAHAAVGLEFERDAALDREALDERCERVRDELRRGDAGERGLAERDDERLARDPLVALALGALVVGQVADEAGVDLGRAPDRNPRDGELDRKQRAVGALGLELDALLEDAVVAAFQQAPQATAMRLAVGGRDDQLGHVGADHVVARVAEEPLGGGVELDDDTVRVDRDDPVQGDAQDGIVDAGSRDGEVRSHWDTRRLQSGRA
jgi:hypothetical protein